MTAPYADLIERLRATYQHWIKGHSTQPINPDGPEAAKAIEALQAEVERLSAAPPASVGREEWFFVAGPVWLEPELTDEDDNPIWTSEVQLHGGHAVVATVHGESEAQAVARRDAILAALARTEAPTPPEGEG